MRDSQTRSATMSIARSSESELQVFARGARYFTFSFATSVSEQLKGSRAFRAKISLADRALRIALDRDEFSVLVINQLAATDAAIRDRSSARPWRHRSARACARVFSDIASRPVPSLRSRIWRRSGHFERDRPATTSMNYRMDAHWQRSFGFKNHCSRDSCALYDVRRSDAFLAGCPTT